MLAYLNIKLLNHADLDILQTDAAYSSLLLIDAAVIQMPSSNSAVQWIDRADAIVKLFYSAAST